MRYLILFVSLFWGSIINLDAQLAADALRFSTYNYGGSTARSMGAGNSIGALGADYSVLSINPAGLGMYRRGEFLLTPAVGFTKTSALLSGTEVATNRTNTDFNITNMGMVFTSTPRDNNWKTFNVGLGFNKIADYEQTFYYEGKTPATVVDRFLDVANDTGLDDFEAGLAFDANAIYPEREGSERFIGDFSDLAAEFPISKNQQVERAGTMNEVVLSFAGNYKEKLLVGMTVGVPILSFTETKIYGESDIDADEIPLFNELEYIERLSIEGSGLNVKLGLIYRLSQTIRLGAAIHTPSYLRLTDRFSTELTYSFTEPGAAENNTNVTSPIGTFDYNLNTPWRYFAQAGFVLGRSGFISTELIYTDYGSSNFNLTRASNNPDDVAYQDVLNQEVNNSFQSAIDMKIGGELALQRLRLRAGYQLGTSAVTNRDEWSGVISLGGGIRGENTYLDLVYQRATRSEQYTPYLTSLGNAPVISNQTTTNRYMMTIGYKF